MRVLLAFLLAISLAGGAANKGQTSAPSVSPTSAPTEATHANLDVLTTVRNALGDELQHSSYPLAVGFVALLFGFFMLLDGERFFNTGVIFAIAVVVGILTKQAVLSYWDEHHTSHVYHRPYVADFVGLEVGLVAAVAAHKGDKGVLVVLGAAIGFCIAKFVSEVAVYHLQLTDMQRPEVMTAWYTLCALPLSIMLYKDKHLGLLAIVSPIAGGAFVSSALLYFGTELFDKFGCAHDVCAGHLTPNTGQWIEFFTLQFRSGLDVGIFAGSTAYNWQMDDGKTIFGDQVLVRLVWILLALIGVKIQLNRHKKRTGASGDVKTKKQGPPGGVYKSPLADDQQKAKEGGAVKKK